MQTGDPVLVLGASARAAVFSALRGGLVPWWADLFGDLDLRARAPGVIVEGRAYPHGLAKIIQEAPAGPWLYTGALENHPTLISALAKERPLWGHDADVLAIVRDPMVLAGIFRRAGLPYPEVRKTLPERSDARRWLVKPMASAGGRHIHFLERDTSPTRRDVYYQEWIAGISASALYIADDRQARFLGATRQLVGEDWLHAAPFHYSGSIGPMELSAALCSAVEQLGNALCRAAGLWGVFGVDLVIQDDTAWPVEINPRYTASAEVLEYALGISVLAEHRQVFDPGAPELPARHGPTDGMIGKAILFAQRQVVFPAAGPWTSVLEQPKPVEELPAFADIPAAGQAIAPGKPVLTFFTRAPSAALCEMKLRETAARLDRLL
jgi:predicted ATP-grasp superfamily ATP-dependent carboligase